MCFSICTNSLTSSVMGVGKACIPEALTSVWELLVAQDDRKPRSKLAEEFKEPWDSRQRDDPSLPFLSSGRTDKQHTKSDTSEGTGSLAIKQFLSAYGPDKLSNGSIPPTHPSAFDSPPQGRSLWSGFRKDLLGLLLPKLPATSTPTGSDFPAFSLVF